MKKFVAILTLAVMLTSILSVFTYAEEVTLIAPSDSEIMPTRDFYIIGTIDRGGKSAKQSPMNVRINLINNRGEIVRSAESNVASDGQSPVDSFMSDYDKGYSINETKGSLINSFTPPDIIFGGQERNSLLFPYNKVVVKEDYFAAVIYGGATKDFELNYYDKYDRGLVDITEGEYDLEVILLDLYGEELSRKREKIVFANKKPRLITDVDLKDYAKENDMVLSNSIAGYWDIAQLLPIKTNGFAYCIPQRLLLNSNVEYGKSKKVNILLNNINLKNAKTNVALGSVFGEDNAANISYLYFDIGDQSVEFDFAGNTFTKEANIIKSNSSQFVKISRAEMKGEGYNTVDFNLEDGIVFKNNVTLYGVFSPINPVSVLDDGDYIITNDVAKIKAEVINDKGKVVFTKTVNPLFAKGNETYKAEFEYTIDIECDENMLSYDNLELKVYALNRDEEILCESENVAIRAISDGKLISGYEDSYWGKVFCDTANLYGEAPSGIPLSPDKHISRGNFATLVNRLMGYSKVGDGKFADLNEKSIFYTDCITAKEIGYMTGDENGNVNASSLITREEAMIILARISGATKGEKEIEFKDNNLISFWAKDYVDALCTAGIVSGYDGYINPKKNITVAEAAALVIKTLKWMYSGDEVLPVEEGNNFVAPENVTDLSKLEIKEVDFSEGFSKEKITEFFKENAEAFVAVSEYFNKNFKDGVFVGKVGNGLEIRDYKKGEFIKFTEDATKLVEDMGVQFASFSIRYNTTKGNDIYFAFGKNSEKKEFGIVNTDKSEISGRKLVEISENWYYYIQE